MKYTHCQSTGKHVFAAVIAFTCPLVAQTDDQQSITKQKNMISVEISYGELIDKITILEIKAERIKTRSKLHNVQTELRILYDTYHHDIPLTKEVESLKKELKKVNEQLWEIEDDIRLKEHNKEFDDEFVELARLVYITNDRRGEIKKKINGCLGSYLMEEKEYTKYEV